MFFSLMSSLYRNLNHPIWINITQDMVKQTGTTLVKGIEYVFVVKLFFRILREEFTSWYFLEICSSSS